MTSVDTCHGIQETLCLCGLSDLCGESLLSVNHLVDLGDLQCMAQRADYGR